MNFNSLFTKSFNEIIPGLYIGNAITAKFALNEYDLIINCTKNIPESLPLTQEMKGPRKLDKLGKVIRIPIDDLPEDSDILLSYLPNITKEIHQILINKGKVLVHCSMGVSRSCTVIAAYLIRYYDFTYDNVITFIKSKRKEAFFQEIRFEKVLQYFETTFKKPQE